MTLIAAMFWPLMLLWHKARIMVRFALVNLTCEGALGKVDGFQYENMMMLLKTAGNGSGTRQKELYVALTRASRSLFVLSTSPILGPRW
jgi:hypothetical protein